jgi:hypothetical protein
MRGFVAPALAAAAVVLAGCGGQAVRESEPPAQSTDAREAARTSGSTVEVPDGFRLRRLPEVGLQLALPRGWIGLARRDAAFPGTLQTLSRIDGSVGGAIAMLAQPDSPLRLLALVPPAAAGQRFAGSMSLVVTAAPPARAALGSWKQDVVRALREDETVRGRVDVQPVKLGVGDGVRLSFQRMRRGERVATVQIAAVEGDRMTLLVLTTTPARARALGKTLDRIAGTIAGLGGARSPGLTS